MKGSHVKFALYIFALIFPVLSSWAAQQPLIELGDPSGDDHGDGTLIYPRRADFKIGDLDLLQLKISRDEEGFWLEAQFKNPVRDPANVPGSIGAESLANFARKGFYQFNIDVYVDTDRINGSGNIFTLPGRHVRIDPAYAWEKAVILTPRPELMRHQLLDALAEQYPGRDTGKTEASIDHAIFFPTRIQVRGKSIAFFVPADFFAGSDGSDWAVTALVTGALTTIPADLTLFPSTKQPLERLQLGVMQPSTGQPLDTFGYSGAPPSPVVDMLGISKEQQDRQFAAKEGLVGVAWGAHALNGKSSAVSTKDATVTEQVSSSSYNAKPAESFESLFLPGNPVPGQPKVAIPAETSASVARRLQALQQLFDQKLIDEIEYKEQKKRILNEL